jgi:hypothetical protein
MKAFTIGLIIAAWYIAANPHKAHPQSPNLVLTAAATPGYPAGQAPSLTLSSDSTAPWKCFTVSGSASTYNVIWAESSGTSGGIYFGSITVSTSGAPAPAPVPVAPSDLPIATLTTAVSGAVASVDQATATKMGDTYEALAKSVDTGVIVSPLQLQLATGTQLLANFTSPELVSLSKVTAAVNGWVDAQQCSGKLSGDRIDRYATAYHAIARALKHGMLAPTPAKEPGTQKPGQSPAASSPCASGKCPVPRQRVRR